MVETGKPTENGKAREAGIASTFSSWPNVIDGIEELGSEVLREALERIEAPLEIAELELLDRLRSLLEAELSEEAYGKALELVEMLAGVSWLEIQSRQGPVVSHCPRAALEGRYLETTLQSSLRTAGLDTTEAVDVFVQISLGNDVGNIREALPEFPADWYKHDWTVARLRERRAARLANEGS